MSSTGQVASDEGVIALIVDPAFGEKIRAVAARFEVWIVPSPENRAAVEAIWREKTAGSVTHDVTYWSEMPDVSSTAGWLGMLGDFWLGPPMNAIAVIGTDPHDHVLAALADYEFTVIEPGSYGFRASRKA